MQASLDPLIGADIGSYRVDRALAHGGMGLVYLGVHPTIGSRVAIKVLSERCAEQPTLVERFFSEARAVNLIKHEAIVSVLDMATLPDGRPYLVMEYLDGESLGAMIRRTQRLPLGGVARVIGEVCAALAATHLVGIVHRDLKPDNVFVTEKGRAKVLDFGIAKLASSLTHEHAPRTGTDDFLGTPAYMSPEQITNPRTVDARSDIYSLGVVLYEAATGRVPFIGTTFEIMRAHVDDPVPPPRSLRDDMPPALEAVIVTALAKDPAERFASATAMGAALAAATRDLPRETLAPSRTEPPRSQSIVETPAAPSAVEEPQPVPAPRRRWIPIAIAFAVAAGSVTFALVMTRGKGHHAARLRDRTLLRAPTQFDVHAFLDTATALARAEAEDAALVEIRLDPVHAGGLVDLTRGDHRIIYVSTREPCTIVVVLGAERARVERRDGGCDATPVRPPSCRIGEVLEENMNAAVETYATGVGDLARISVRYTAVAGQKLPQWRITQLFDTEDVNDDCAKQ